MPTTQLDKALVVVTEKDLEEVVTTAIGALREADSAFGNALEPLFVSSEASGGGSAPGFGAREGPLGPEGIRSLAAACREHWPDYALRITILSRGFADHWFSHRLGRHDTVLVSLYGWEHVSSLPREAFVAYEMLLWGSSLLAEGYDAERLIHAEANGCIFDLCANRPDIDRKLRLSDACPRCRSQLTEMGMPIPRFRRLLEAVRRLALPAW